MASSAPFNYPPGAKWGIPVEEGVRNAPSQLAPLHNAKHYLGTRGKVKHVLMPQVGAKNRRICSLLQRATRERGLGSRGAPTRPLDSSRSSCLSSNSRPWVRVSSSATR